MALENILLLAATSATTPSPLVITQSSSYASDYDAWHAFGGGTNGSTGYGWLSDNVTNPQYMQIDLGAAYAISKYYIQTGPNSMPSAWTVKASNTGAFAGEEVTLDTRSGLSLSAATWYPYSFSNTTAYRYYRISFASAAFVSIGQWVFVGGGYLPSQLNVGREGVLIG